MAATIPILLIAAYFIQKYYLLTSRQIRLLDLEAKSPLYTLFAETADGVSAIRGLGWQRQFNDEAIVRLNYSQKPFYMLYVIQRWLTLVIDLTAGTMGIIVLTLALCIPSSTDSGFLGVALTSILSFNIALTQTISAWTNAETSIGSITRTRSFARDTPSELSDKDIEPDATWPVGNINVENLSVVFE
jgi:ATP-binding cassette, subfamily C (CFTR/MRP), member 1